MSGDNPFNIIGNEEPKSFGTEVEGAKADGDLNERIKSIIDSADLVLFMKGNPAFPQCGFSANTIGILNQLEVEFKTFDILGDPDVRAGIKVYSNWPTFPQLYFKGKLVGGNDIITEMFEDGDLQELVKS